MPAPVKPVKKTSQAPKKETPVSNTTDGFWDDDELKPESSQFAKFAKPGDRHGGTITKMSKHVFEDGSVAPELKFADVDDEPSPILTAGAVLMKQALYELRPQVGDELWIELTRIEQRGQKTLKHYTTTLTRTTGETEEVEL